MSDKTKSFWAWFGCGCVGLVVLAIGGVIAAVVGGGMFVRDYVEDLKDPVARGEQVRKILGTEELPAGFEPQMFFRVPWLIDMVVVSDGEPAEFDERGNAELEARHLGENAFVFFSMRDLGGAREDMEALLSGKTENVHQDIRVNFHSRETLGRGELDVPPQHLRWAAHRGEYRDRHEDREGIYSILLVDCPKKDDRVRFAFFWQQRETVEGEALDLEGTPADEETLRSFISHFNLCGA